MGKHQHLKLTNSTEAYIMIESILNYLNRDKLKQLEVTLAGLLAEKSVIDEFTNSLDFAQKVTNSVAIAETDKKILQLKRALL